MTCWLCGFKTTELATNAKAPTCKNGPCQICIAVANVDEEINQAVATIQRLLAKRCNLRSEQNRIHGTLIHRLPTELTSYIFEFLVPTRTEWGEPFTSPEDLGTMPRRFGTPIIPYISVCRSWRDIAWSIPSLWSTIHIALERGVPSSESSEPSPINPVHDWILRSGTLPLTLDIKGRYLRKESKSVIDAISRCSNRWHSLSFDMSLELLHTFRRNNIQCHLLKNLRIYSGYVNQLGPVLLSNLTINPEKIEIHGPIPFKTLLISWDRLTSAKVERCYSEDLTQLFQRASQMTHCHILEPCERVEDGIFQMPPIIHHGLKELGLRFCAARKAEMVLGSLTLPCLQEFHANQMFLLKYLPALVHRSSCPLTRITLDLIEDGEWDIFDLQPLPGIIDLVIENVAEPPQTFTIRILLERYLPDLRHLILRPQAFRILWKEVTIPMLLDRKWPRLDTATNGRHPKIIVIDRDRFQSSAFDIAEWKSYVEEGLTLMQLDANISLTKDGFEISIPED